MCVGGGDLIQKKFGLGWKGLFSGIGCGDGRGALQLRTH